jgi:hypothetical protein
MNPPPPPEELSPPLQETLADSACPAADANIAGGVETNINITAAPDGHTSQYRGVSYHQRILQQHGFVERIYSPSPPEEVNWSCSQEPPKIPITAPPPPTPAPLLASCSSQYLRTTNQEDHQQHQQPCERKQTCKPCVPASSTTNKEDQELCSEREGAAISTDIPTQDPAVPHQLERASDEAYQQTSDRIAVTHPGCPDAIADTSHVATTPYRSGSSQYRGVETSNITATAPDDHTSQYQGVRYDQQIGKCTDPSPLHYIIPLTIDLLIC